MDVHEKPLLGTTYTVTATPKGAPAQSASFVTKQPPETFVGYFTPEANSTSGVGMPVSINFTEAVKDRAAVEKAITVTAEPAVEAVGHWFSDTRLDFRPEEYWAAGTKITLSLRLKDVEGHDWRLRHPVEGRHLPHRPPPDQHRRPRRRRP